MDTSKLWTRILHESHSRTTLRPMAERCVATDLALRLEGGLHPQAEVVSGVDQVGGRRDQLLVNGAGGGPARLHDALILHTAHHAQHTTLDNGTNNTDVISCWSMGPGAGQLAFMMLSFDTRHTTLSTQR